MAERGLSLILVGKYFNFEVKLKNGLSTELVVNFP